MTLGRGEDAGGATIVLMCGLPASGKTTTAMRLHARLGGVLIGSCDIYQELDIVLPEWVERTAGFTTNVTEHDRVRDSAYLAMARRVDLSVAKGSPLVIIDAVHDERAKRQRLYEISASRGATPFQWRRRIRRKKRRRDRRRSNEKSGGLPDLENSAGFGEAVVSEYSTEPVVLRQNFVQLGRRRPLLVGGMVSGCSEQSRRLRLDIGHPRKAVFGAVRFVATERGGSFVESVGVDA